MAEQSEWCRTVSLSGRLLCVSVCCWLDFAHSGCVSERISEAAKVATTAATATAPTTSTSVPS